MDIIGAGIGGLTTAIALQQKGIATRIFEQAPKFKPIGAGIVLASNAMQVYQKLGLAKEIAAAGIPISTMHLTTPQLTAFSKIDLSHFENKYNIKNIAIHRGKLQEILVRQLDAKQIHLNHQLQTITEKDAGYLLAFKNGETLFSKQILGADGIQSKVRNSLFDDTTIRSSQQICWRGVCEFQLPKKHKNIFTEAWGKGNRFGFVEIAPNLVYWYAVKTMEQAYGSYTTNDWPSLFTNYDSMAQELIARTPKESIHVAELTDLLALKKWYKKDVCLLGDAAHATTPNMGQGACQAIEDAYVLAACLQQTAQEEAYAKFQQIRQSKVSYIVKSSWNFGKMAHWKNPLAIGIRNNLLKMTPDFINRLQIEKLFQLETISG